MLDGEFSSDDESRVIPRRIVRKHLAPQRSNGGLVSFTIRPN